MPQHRHFDLNLLRTFITVYQLGSFTQAAEKLDLTQSSVSNSISRLKKVLGVNLFVRDGQRIVPTAAAQQLFRQVNNNFLQIEQAVSQFERFDLQSHSRQFTVLSPDSIMQMLVSDIELLTEGTDIDVVFKESPPSEEEMMEAITLDKVDLVIDIYPPSGSVVEYQKIFSDDLVVVARKDHPRIKGAISKAQFFAEKHVLVNLERRSSTALETVSVEPLLDRKVFSEQASMYGALWTVNSSNAIATTLSSFTHTFGETFDLQVLEPPIETSPMSLFMIWHKKYNHNQAHQWLREAITSAMGQYQKRPDSSSSQS
ncbi:LysR family transcriptional regulator [Vibrio sp. WXL103]|uniref:LysR family transcriptional regulator n=1 Tax=unclassified Vibrio TaxID=2614977 RepID=UPI003EC5B94F